MSSTSYQPETDYVVKSVSAKSLTLALSDSVRNVTFLDPCRGSPEGIFDDPPSSLRFDIDTPALWFKTTDQGVTTGWVNISSGGGGGVGGDDSVGGVEAGGVETGRGRRGRSRVAVAT